MRGFENRALRRRRLPVIESLSWLCESTCWEDEKREWEMACANTNTAGLLFLYECVCLCECCNGPHNKGHYSTNSQVLYSTYVKDGWIDVALHDSWTVSFAVREGVWDVEMQMCGLLDPPKDHERQRWKWGTKWGENCRKKFIMLFSSFFATKTEAHLNIWEMFCAPAFTTVYRYISNPKTGLYWLINGSSLSAPRIASLAFWPVIVTNTIPELGECKRRSIRGWVLEQDSMHEYWSLLCSFSAFLIFFVKYTHRTH